MKQSVSVLSTVLVATLVSACTSIYPGDREYVANEASTYCVNQGGEFELVKDENGHYKKGICNLPNGQAIEQWENYEHTMMQDAKSMQ